MSDRTFQPDTVVLDLDGVLVDVSESYRRAVKESVRIVYGDSVDDALVQELKDLGGFNNDWKVTYACALFGLIRGYRPDLTVSEWTSFIQEHGTGLSAAEQTVGDLLDEPQADRVRADWNKDKLWRIFQELYLGSEQYSRIENEDSVLERSGYIKDEPILIDDDVYGWLNETVNLGVLTGRPRVEAKMALDRLSWDVDSSPVIAMEDWDHEKPSPEGLLRLAEGFNADAIVYVGDTLDDIRTARNAAQTDSDREYYGIGVLTGGLTGEAGRKKYESAGAAAVLDSINDLPDLFGAGQGAEVGL